MKRLQYRLKEYARITFHESIIRVTSKIRDNAVFIILVYNFIYRTQHSKLLFYNLIIIYYFINNEKVIRLVFMYHKYYLKLINFPAMRCRERTVAVAIG